MNTPTHEVDPSDISRDPVESSDLSGLGSGLRWSVINQVVLRIGTFGSGIVLARLLLPEDFGIYASGLAVLKLLMAVNDLGVILGVVRFKGSPRVAAATAWTMSTGTSLVLFAGAFLSAPLLADAMGSSHATGVIRLMATMVVFDGLAAIPSALLTRAFLQGRQAAAELIGLSANVVLSIVLASNGAGAWSLAWGQVTGNAVTLMVLVLLSDSLPRPTYDRLVARQLASFGVPLAFSTLVEQGVLNADYVIIGATLGTEQLGIYLLAFNISSWPISIITFAVRRVSIVAFSKLTEQRERMAESFLHTLAVLLGAGAFVAVLLSALAAPIVDTVYGARWAASATPLRLLAMLGLARIAVMFMFDLMIGDGRSRTVLRLQATWLVFLVPALILGTNMDGIRGAAIAHLIVTIVVVLPMFTLALRPSGVHPNDIFKVAIRPLVSAVPTALAAIAVASTVGADPLKVVVGGTAGAVVYLAVWLPRNRSLQWLASQRRELAAR